MAHFSGEMEFEFVEGQQAFVTTDKALVFLRGMLAKGDVQGAARLYEDGGATCAADLLREAQTASSNSQRALAEMFVLARDFKNAAAVFEQARVLDRAAQFYEQGLDLASAARCWEKIGDLPRAAVCLERAGDVARAIELYRRAGPSQGLAEALARQGHYYDAAGIYKQIFNLKGEIEMLRLVPLASDVRIPAVLRLAELLEQYNHPDQAAGLLLETLRQHGQAAASQPLYGALARVLEGMGRLSEAAQVRARVANLLPGQTAPAAAPVAAAPVVVGAPVAAPAPVAVAAAAPQPAAPRDPFSTFVDPFSGKPSASAAPVDAYGHLKGLPIFAELAVDDMRELYRCCDDLHFTDGQVLVEQGVAGRGLFVVVQGTVRVARQDAQGMTELARLGAGAQVGELSLLDDAPTSARVIAAGPVAALFISRDRFAQFLATHDAAALRIFRLFARSLAARLRESNLRK